MFQVRLSTKILAALAVLLGLGAAQLSIPAALAVDYPPRAETTAELSLEKSRVSPGESNTARVSVDSGSGNPQGQVTFKVSGHQAESRPLVNGEASYSMPTDLKAGKTYKVVARYNGTRIYRPSSDTEWVTVSDDEVAGSEGAQGGGDGSANRSGTGEDGSVLGDAADSGALPNVGSDAGTSLMALGGLGLLGAGAVALLLHRRRVRA